MPVYLDNEQVTRATMALKAANPEYADGSFRNVARVAVRSENMGAATDAVHNLYPYLPKSFCAQLARTARSA